jgi:hypothetical protein
MPNLRINKANKTNVMIEIQIIEHIDNQKPIFDKSIGKIKKGGNVGITY